MGVAQYDVVGHDAALFVGWACQRNQGRAACDQMAHLDGVAQGVNLRVGGLHVFIDGDAAALAQHEPRFLGESGLGTHADTQDHQIRRDLPAALQVDGNTPFGGLLEAYDAILKVEPHPLVRQVAVDECRHREVERGHHLVGHLHHIDMQPEAVQVFGHLQTDESAAHDHGMLRSLRIDILFDGIRVGDAAQREDFRALDALDLRAQGLGSGRKHQPVVRLRVGLAGGEVVHRNLLARAVDRGDLLLGADVDAEAVGEAFRRLHEELRAVGDRAADVVGQAAVGIRHVFTPFEENHFGLLVQAAQAGRYGGPSGHASDNKNFHGSVCVWFIGSIQRVPPLP